MRYFINIKQKIFMLFRKYLKEEYKNKIFQAFFILFIGVFTLAYVFVIRYNVEHIKIIIEERLNIENVSNLTFVYYIFYSFFQIPFGFAFDKYSTKSVFSLSMSLSAIGLAIFGFAQNEYVAILGRILLATGSAAAIPLLAKITSIIFIDSVKNKLLGLLISCSIIGGAMYQPTYTDMIFDNKYINSVFGDHAYSIGFLILSAFGLLSVILFLLFGNKSKPTNNNKNIEDVNITHVLNLLLKPKIILYCILGGLMIPSFEGFPDLYGKDLLTIGYNFTQQAANWIKTYFFAGLAIGASAMLFVPIKMNHRYLIVIYGIGFLICWYYLLNSKPSFLVAFFAYNGLGLFSAYQMALFSLIEANMMSKKYSATAVSFANSFIMGVGAIFQIILPWSVKQFAYYGEASAIIYGLSIIPLLILIAIIGFILVPGYDEMKSMKR